MAEYNLGTARAKIVIDAGGAATTLIDTEKQVKQFEKSVGNTSDTLVRSGAAIGGVGAVIAAGFVGAINSAANFESALNAIAAVSNATVEDMEKVRAKALQLGKDTTFSASESALAMEELIKAGLTVSDVLNGAADATVALAAAGSIELPEAATISANAMNAFGLAASELPKVADLIAGAANASAIDVREFGMSLQQSGAVANLVGLSFDDLAVAIAQMGNAGIKGSDAGTSLKTFLQNLIPVTEKEKDLFDELGITVNGTANKFFDAEGKIRSMADIADVLNTATRDMSEEQKLLALSTAFGSDAIRAAAIVADGGRQGFEDLAASMGKVTAAETAATRMKGLNGQLEQLKGSVETLAITIGTPLLGAVNSVVSVVTSLVNKFLELSPTTQKIIVAVVGIVGALALLTGGALLTLGMVGKAIIGFRELAAVMPIAINAIKAITLAVRAFSVALLTNPIFLIIAAVVALGAAIYLAYKRFEPFRNVVDSVGRALKTGFLAVLNFFQDVPRYVGQAVQAIKNVWGGIADWFTDRIRGFTLGFAAFKAAFSGGGITTAGNKIVGVFERVGHGARILIDFLKSLPETIISFFTSLPARVGSAMAAVNSAVVSFLQRLPGLIGDWLGFALGYFIRLHIQAVQTMTNMGTKILTSVGSFLSRLPGIIWDFLIAAFQFMVRFEKNMREKAIEVGTNVLDSIVQFFSQLPGRIWDFLVQAFNSVANWATDMVDKARETGSNFVNSSIEFFKQLPGRIGQFLSDAYNSAVSWVSSMLNKARELGGNFVSGVVDGLRDLPSKVGDVFAKALEAVKEQIGKAFDAAKSFASGLWKGFKDGLGIHSPSFIEKAMTNIRKNVFADTKALAGQVRILNDAARSLTLGETNLSGLGSQMIGTAVSNVSVHFDISGGSVDDVQAIKKAVVSPAVLKTLIDAARAGRR